MKTREEEHEDKRRDYFLSQILTTHDKFRVESYNFDLKTKVTEFQEENKRIYLKKKKSLLKELKIK